MTLEADSTPTKGRRRNSAAAAPATESSNAAVDAQLGVLGVELTPLSDADIVPLTAEPSAAELAAISDADRDRVLNPFTARELPDPAPTRQQAREQRTDSRQATNQPTPSTRRFGPVGKKLPGSEHVKLHKRLETGKLAYVGEYHSSDMAQSQNIESFIAKYIQPKFGPGEYQITGVTASGQEFDAGSVTLMAPLGEAIDSPTVGGTTPLNLIQQMLDREAERRDAELRALSSNQKDPIKTLKELHELQQSLSPQLPPLMPSMDSDRRSNATETMMAGMMSMMTTVLAQALQPKQPDPLLLALINNLAAAKNTPTPVVDPTQQLVQLSEVIKNLNGNNNGNGGNNQMLELLMRERMSPGDVLSLVNQVKGERGTDDLKKSVENLGFLLNTVQQLRQHTEPSGGSGFWDAVNSLLSNPSLASAVGSRVNGAARQQPAPQVRVEAPQARVQQLPAPQQRDPLALKARELAARKMRLEELEIAKREQQLGLVATPAAAPAPAPVEEAPVMVEPVEAQAPKAEDEEPVTLPPGITDHINSFMSAQNDGEIVSTAIDMVFSFAESERWRPYSEVIVGLILRGDRAQFLQYMSSLLVSLRTVGMMEDALARKIVETLHNHFETIVNETRERLEQLNAEGEADSGESEEDDGEVEGEEEPEDLLQLE